MQREEIAVEWNQPSNSSAPIVVLNFPWDTNTVVTVGRKGNDCILLFYLCPATNQDTQSPSTIEASWSWWHSSSVWIPPI